MAKYKSVSRYSEQYNSELRFNIMDALQELATFKGVSIQQLQHSGSNSFFLSKVTSQKIAREMKNLIDYGLVVKEIVRGKPVVYMLRENYDKICDEEKANEHLFVYDNTKQGKTLKNRMLKTRDILDEEDDEALEAEMIALYEKHKKKYKDEW